MNGIVTGKIEKTAGSMVFKTVRSATIPTNNTIMGLYFADITNPYVRFTNIKNQVNIMSIQMIDYLNSGSYSTDMQTNSGGFYDDFYIYRNNDNDSVYIILAQSQAGTLNRHFSLFEVGTLEIA